MDGPLPVETEKAGQHGGPSVPVGILISGVRRVDGVYPGDTRGSNDLDAGEVPEVAGVVANGVEVAVDPCPLGCREVAGAEDDGLEATARPGDLHGVGQALGLLDQDLQA